MKYHQPLRSLLTITVSSLAIGCSAGPDFQRPSPPAQAGYLLPHDATQQPQGLAQTLSFQWGKDLPAQWWELFHSPAITALVSRAIAENPDIQAAQQALTVARENVAAAQGANWPTVNAELNPTRTKTSTALSAVPANNARYYTLHTAQLSINYVLDLWGANRRQVESLQAQAEQQRFVYEATYLTLTSNVVNAAIQDAALHAQIALENRIVAAQRAILATSQRLYDAGQLAQIDVLLQQDALAQAQTTLNGLEKAAKQQHDLVAALSGGFPNQPTPSVTLEAIETPRNIPVSLPLQLTQQRPDMRAAEANWHAVCAQYGVAIANRLPNLTLSGNIGSSAITVGELLTSGQGIWAIAAQITQPLFDGGTLRHRQRAAAAAVAQAAAAYRGVLVTAFQNVADALHALQLDAQLVSDNHAALDRANRSLTIARQQLDLGDLSDAVVQQSVVNQAQSEIALIQAQTNQLTDTVALFQALGGGWWNR